MNCRQYQSELSCRAFFTTSQASDANKAWTMKAPMINTAQPMSPVLRAKKWFVLMGLLLTLPASGFGQTNPVPQGGEYALSGSLNGDQTAPRVAVGAGGGFFVFQDNGIDGNGLGIGARRLDSTFAPAGPVFRLNEKIIGDQEKPSVALTGSGGAVAVWQSGKPGFQDIVARFINADGSFATPDITVNITAKSYVTRYTTNWLVFRNNRPKYRSQRLKQTTKLKQERNGGPAVAVLNNGNAVAVYASGRQLHEKTPVLVHRVRFSRISNRFITNSVVQYVESDTDGFQDIYFQTFSAAGEKLGGEIRANQSIPFNQSHPAIAVLADGTFVIAWVSDRPNFVQPEQTTFDIFARRFDSSGIPLGDEFVVNTVSRPCKDPAVAGHAEGGFTITWAEKTVVRTNSIDIFARTFDGAGTPVAGALRVNSHTYGDQFAPAIVASAGAQVIVWTSLAQDGSREGVFGRALNNGALAGDEFRVNTTTHLRQLHPAIAGDGAGRFLVLWSSYQTMAGFDLYGQRYVTP